MSEEKETPLAATGGASGDRIAEPKSSLPISSIDLQVQSIASQFFVSGPLAQTLAKACFGERAND